MLENRSLAFKLVIAILGSTGLIFLAVLGYNYHHSKEVLLQEMEKDAQTLSRQMVYRIESQLRSIEQVPLTIALMLENRAFTDEEVKGFIRSAIEKNPDIFGMAVAFEPYAFNPADLYYSPYGFRQGNSISLSHLGTPAYHYFNYDWYQIPKELDEAAWSEPYFDEGGGGIVMATFSAPFYRTVNGQKIFQGVVTADMSLSRLQDAISSVKLFETGYAFLISRTGLFVTHRNKPAIMRESIFSVAEERGDPALRAIGRRMIHGEEGLVPIKDFLDRGDSWMYFSPLPSAGASVGVVVPENELFGTLRDMTVGMLALSMTGLLALLGAIVLISGRFTRPIKVLSLKALELARGNLDVDLPQVKSHDEVGTLNESFRKMRAALKEYIADLAATTRAKERIESELKIARAIQMSFLPKRFPPFPDEARFDIYAALEPAREVGGDLYDFFLIGKEKLFFTIGDVSGKGVPAALFMAVSKTLIKGTCEQGISPSEVLQRVNHELCQENEANMFVSVFAGMLDFTTGELTYSNGGHNPPLIIRRDGSVHWLDVGKSVVLGVFESSTYTALRTNLDPGDTLLLYTDGITEAQNSAEEFYTDDRLVQAAHESSGLPPQVLVKNIMTHVHEFAQGAEQFDDMAVLAVRQLAVEG